MDYEFDPGRVLTPEEIEKIKDSITHVSKIPFNIDYCGVTEEMHVCRSGRRHESVDKLR